MKLTLWERIRRAEQLLKDTRYVVKRRRKPIRPGAIHPNPQSQPVKPTPPTRPPGHGLTGWRKNVHIVLLATLGNPYGWTYNEVRPLALPRRRLTAAELATPAVLKATLAKLVKAFRSDCSWGAKTAFFLARCKDDPTGENWNGWGNSSSAYLHLPKRPGLDNAYSPTAAALAACEVGDIGVVGVNGSDHVFVILEKGENPLVWSDGHGGAPDSYHVLDDARRPISILIPKG